WGLNRQVHLFQRKQDHIEPFLLKEDSLLGLVDIKSSLKISLKSPSYEIKLQQKLLTHTGLLHRVGLTAEGEVFARGSNKNSCLCVIDETGSRIHERSVPKP